MADMKSKFKIAAIHLVLPQAGQYIPKFEYIKHFGIELTISFRLIFKKMYKARKRKGRAMSRPFSFVSLLFCIYFWLDASIYGLSKVNTSIS